jgi:hypothetical protein
VRVSGGRVRGGGGYHGVCDVIGMFWLRRWWGGWGGERRYGEVELKLATLT